MSDDPIKVMDAEISDDGTVCLFFNHRLEPGFAHTKKAVFTPEVLFELATECGEIPPKEEVDPDYQGLPFVELDAVFPPDNDGDEEVPPGENEEGEEE